MFSSDLIARAWREQIAQYPALSCKLDERELYLGFAKNYEKLRAAPRQTRRALQRKCKRSLAAVAFFLTVGNFPALSETITVADRCALIDAIIAANSDTAQSGCAAGSGADTIVLPPGRTKILKGIIDNTYGATGLPLVTTDITIEGNGSIIKRDDAAPKFRIFAVGATGKLSLKNVKVTGGVADGEDASGSGGGIFVSDGTASLINSTITGNSARRGGGVYNTDMVPGDLAYGTLELNNTTISRNSAEFGGGVHGNGLTRANNCTVSKNTASSSGGGFYNAAGGTYDAGRVTITNCTISGNSAAEGGGIFNSLRGFIGLDHATISDNRAETGGGISNVSRATVDLRHSLVSGNKAASAREMYNFPGNYYDAPGTVISDNFNLFGHGGNAGVENFTPGATDIVPATPLAQILKTLQDNGGPTRTHALIKGSPAVDAIPATDCPQPELDQRGFSRPVDANFDQIAECDIGALERIPEIVSCEGRQLSKGCTVNGIADQLCFGTAGDDTVEGTNNNDLIQGAFGNDVIQGNAGDDTICGGHGNDILSGDDGKDRLFGQEQDDTLSGNDKGDWLNGGAGVDVCNGDDGIDNVVSCESISGVP